MSRSTTRFGHRAEQHETSARAEPVFSFTTRSGVEDDDDVTAARAASPARVAAARPQAPRLQAPPKAKKLETMIGESDRDLHLYIPPDGRRSRRFLEIFATVAAAAIGIAGAVAWYVTQPAPPPHADANPPPSLATFGQAPPPSASIPPAPAPAPAPATAAAPPSPPMTVPPAPSPKPALTASAPPKPAATTEATPAPAPAPQAAAPAVAPAAASPPVKQPAMTQPPPHTPALATPQPQPQPPPQPQPQAHRATPRRDDDTLANLPPSRDPEVLRQQREAGAATDATANPLPQPAAPDAATSDDLGYVDGQQPRPRGTIDEAAPVATDAPTPLAPQQAVQSAPPSDNATASNAGLRPYTPAWNGAPLPNDLVILPNGQMMVPAGR
jgi:hypothetical protein